VRDYEHLHCLMLCKWTALWAVRLFCLINCVFLSILLEIDRVAQKSFHTPWYQITFSVKTLCATLQTSVYTIYASFICGLFNDAVNDQNIWQ
jgi:hypothetical protein